MLHIYIYDISHLRVNFGSRWGWEVNAAPRPRYPRERPGTHCIGGWVGAWAGLDGCVKSLLPQGFDPWTVQSLASRYSDCALRAQTESPCSVPIFESVLLGCCSAVTVDSTVTDYCRGGTRKTSSTKLRAKISRYPGELQARRLCRRFCYCGGSPLKLRFVSTYL